MSRFPALAVVLMLVAAGFIIPGGILHVEEAHATKAQLAGCQLFPAADADVYEYSYRNWNNSNVGKSATLTAGYHPEGGERRIFIRFRLSPLPGVRSAVLRLYHYHTGGSNGLRLGVYRVLEPWNEGTGVYHSGQVEPDAASGEISWTNQPRIDPNPMAVFTPPESPGGFVDVKIMPPTALWRSGSPNYGMVIKPADPLSPQVGESQYGFFSRENENAGQRPVLLINGGPAEQPTGATGMRSIKLFDPVPRQSSDAFKKNVHERITIDTARWDPKPYHIQKQFRTTLTLPPGRKVLLSPRDGARGQVRVDNFLLFEIESGGGISRFIVGQAEPVFYDGARLPHAASNGLLFPANYDLSEYFPKGTPFTLTVSALDYGGIAELSAVYLLLE